MGEELHIIRSIHFMKINNILLIVFILLVREILVFIKMKRNFRVFSDKEK